MSANHYNYDIAVDPIVGKLRLDSVPWEEPIVMGTMAVALTLAAVILGLVTYKKWWGYLWKEWLTSVDHKRIGVMYIIFSIIMFVRGFADAVMMKAQQALATNGDFGGGFLPPEHYDQIFTAHGVIMIFFVATPMMLGIINVVMPLQIGARDVAFPFLNSLSLWMAIAGGILAMISLFVGEFANTGWLSYVPLAGKAYNPWVGVDYWIWCIQISGIGTTLTVVNFIATIIKMRAPTMGFLQMPVFTWTTLVSSVIGLIIFPIFTVAIAMLTLDRYFDFHFFTNGDGGNQMMWVNLVWCWGHPEVYFLVLPAFGMVSEVVATFCRKRLFGYFSLVCATCVIGILSFLVWAHHFFTMGAGASVNSFFGIATMIIAIPTGVKLYNWIFTMYKGRIEFSAAMWWCVAMLITFTVGGMTGVMLSIPANDFVLHNSMFLVAHFHNTIIGGAVYAYFAAITYWFPKATGWKLNETLGKCTVFFWFIGYWVAWLPLYMTGFNGMTRRLNYTDNPEWTPFLHIAAVGVALIAIGVVFLVVNIAWTVYRGATKHPDYVDTTGDPWDARTLEWATSSPPQFYNFAVMPDVKDRDHLWYEKKHGLAYKKPAKYERIHMPKNTWAGFVIGMLMVPFGFGFVWHIWWLVWLSFFGIIASFLKFNFEQDKDYYVEVEEIEAIEKKWLDSNAGRF